MTNPPVSVIIPSKNRPTEIQAMLASLRAQPTQPIEVIVIDQSDAKYEIDAFPGLRHVHDRQISGLTAARNRGVDLASGEVLLFFDDDVLLDSDCVRYVAEAFGQRPELVGAQCSIHNPWDDKPRSLFDITDSIFRQGFFNARPAVINGARAPRLIDGLASAYRRTLFNRERFDENLPGYGLAEDWDMSKRAARHGALGYVDEAKVRHLHSGQNRSDLRTIVALRRSNFLYLYDKLDAARNPLDRLWKYWFLLGEALRDVKHKIALRRSRNA